VSERVHEYWSARTAQIKSNKEASELFLPRGQAPGLGEIFRNQPLADTLSLISRDGPEAFYRGPIAKSILQTSDHLGGTMAAADLAEYESEWVDPISTSYRVWTVYEMPPNTHGLAVLSMLNIMELFPLLSIGPASADTLHTQIEAQKLAYQDLYAHVGEPRVAKAPVSALLDKAYAARRAASIDPHKANCDPKPGEASQ
jgi:gamma-glutamyltranspeptidase/glutathione hydrolase